MITGVDSATGTKGAGVSATGSGGDSPGRELLLGPSPESAVAPSSLLTTDTGANVVVSATTVVVSATALSATATVVSSAGSPALAAEVPVYRRKL